MSKTVLTMISSRGRGMDLELKQVKDSIEASPIDAQFRYFIKQEVTKNAAYAEGIKSAKTDLLKGTDHIICMDMSLNIHELEMPEYGKKILLQIPFNYMHEVANDKQSRPIMPNKVGSAEFTHIYSHSPFGSDLLKNAYNIEGVEIIEGYCSPLSYVLKDEKLQSRYRDILTDYYPGSEGKKIIGFYFRGKVGKKTEWFLNEENMKEFIKSLPEDYFCLTDSQDMMELLRTTTLEDARNFGYLPQLLQTQYAISISDIVISNQGQFLAYPAAWRKPFYTMQFSETNAEKYIRKNYPELYIDSMEQLLNLLEYTENNADTLKKAAEYFSYDTSKDMREHIIKLLQE